MRPPAPLLVFSLALASCSSGPALDGKSANPGKPVSFHAAAARTGDKTIRLEGVEYGSGDFGVVFAHERPASQDAWTLIAQEAAGKGFHALTFNFRGYGLSEGSRGDLGLIDLDLEAAVKFIRSLGVTKVVLVGGSMGGTAALVVASRTPVNGVVTVSAPASFEGLDARAAVPKLTIPALYIAADGDTSAANDARALTGLRPEQARDIVVGSKEHASELFRGSQGVAVRSRILEFLKEHGR
jgi:pimeloyl-ACP methyl ester carboxylesterase